MADRIMDSLAYLAVAILTIGYWAQVWKIHVHREVRDLSITSYGMLALGFAILTYTAWVERSPVFISKQILTLIPSVIIVFQIIYHQKDEWYDEQAASCIRCGNMLEPRWRHCPDCGADVRGKTETPTPEQIKEKEPEKDQQKHILPEKDI